MQQPIVIGEGTVDVSDFIAGFQCAGYLVVRVVNHDSSRFVLNENLVTVGVVDAGYDHMASEFVNVIAKVCVVNV